MTRLATVIVALLVLAPALAAGVGPDAPDPDHLGRAHDPGAARAGGSFGNAATRLEAYAVSGGQFAYGGYPDVDGLFREQATELDRAKREAVLQRVQQLVSEKAMVAPMYELAFVNGVGRRVDESGLGLIAGYAFSAPPTRI
jgi:ABC-type transport system substrate-binding protein